ncbi:MAG: DUF5110 domain-containing protein [Lachnoclostridium sp.]|nr:DUF5110 domain-containing protein [Lachnoclostridium sp.]
MSIKKIFAAMVAVAAWNVSTNALTINTSNGGKVEVDFVTSDIVKVTNLAPGENAAEPYAAILKGSIDVSTIDLGNNRVMMVSPSGVTATIDKLTGGVDISAGGNISVSDNGLRTLADGKRQLRLSTMGTGSFYGAGERGYSFNLAGDTLVMYNKQNYGYTAGEDRIKQMNITMPLFLSDNGYAVVFDDYAAAEMVMSNPIVYTTESTEPVTYYFVNGGGSMPLLSERLSSLTGRQELPPLWALGYITSKYGYHDRGEMVGAIDTLKRQGYPVDGIVLDLYWYGKEEDMGRLDWDPQQWPDHEKMLADLKKRGVKTVAISQPYVLRNGRGIDNYNELSDAGMLLRDTLGRQQEVTIWVGEGGMFDVSNPDTRQWLRNRYKSLTDGGITGWWGDLGEPEVHPESGLHANGLTTRQYHNRYGNDWSRIIYDLFAEEYPETRLMTMMRGGTTGLQRYSVYPWSTDVSRSWGGLRPQITIMLNSGLSGLGYMGHDVGGFAINPDAPYDPELYVRWLQLGTFSPILRTHAQATAEPYHYPDQQSIILPLIKERYKWLPYNYTLAYENATRGLPLVRPAAYYDTAAGPAADLDDEYLWGHDLLVAPVLEKGAASRKVVFPEGQWIDYRNPSVRYEGNTTVDYPAPLDVLPMFVRAGSFIPQADYEMDNTGDYVADRYTINYYPSETGSYTLYEDDLTSRGALSRNEYALINFDGKKSPDGTIEISASCSGRYPGMKEIKQLTFLIHDVDTPASVTIDGKTASRKDLSYDKSSRTLRLKVKWNTAEILSIVVKK